MQSSISENYVVRAKSYLLIINLFAIALAFAIAAPAGNAAQADMASIQKQLDTDCETAREIKLAPERAQYIDECIQKNIKDSRKECERYYSDYGAQAGSRLPLYYDLPQCVKAFEFRQKNSQ